MATTYEVIASTTVGAGGVASITFTSIPTAYNDLFIFYSVRSNNTSAGSGLFESVKTLINNSTTSTDYFNTRVSAAGSGGLDLSSYQGNIPWGLVAMYSNAANNTANTFSNSMIYIPAYTATGRNKAIFADAGVENNTTNQVGNVQLAALEYAQTSVVSSVTILPEYGTAWVQYSSAILYGIKNA